MAYIAPNTSIYICSGVPLDNSYRNTLYFTSLANQLEYFQGKVAYTFDDQSYQRVNKNTMRVNTKADNLYGCNYLYFQNTSFGTKNFFAFITNVEYVNNVTSEITYEIDVMQTYLRNYDMGYCFVEREHVSNDSIGANLITEQVDFGEPRCVYFKQSGHGAEYKIIMAEAEADTSTYTSNMHCYGGIPTGLTYTQFSDNSAGWLYLAETIAQMVGDNKGDNIVSIWMQLADFTSSSSSLTDATQVVSMDMPTSIDGYVPKNNKLFTFPYNFICVDTGEDSAIYRYEYFNGYASSYGAYPFTLVGSTCPNPEVICAPMGYNTNVTNSTSTSSTINYSEGVILSGFPQIAWSNDTYKEWAANGGLISNSLKFAGSAATVMSSGAGALLGDGSAALSVAGTAVAPEISTAMAVVGVIGMASAINTNMAMSTKGATGHGVQSGSVTAALHSAKNFWFKRMQITYDYARSVDNFFTKFGYQVNRVKVPNRTSRPKWNYVKTAGCTIIPASMPADAVAKVEAIYDNGITFWHDPSIVGNYSGDNSPS